MGKPTLKIVLINGDPAICMRCHKQQALWHNDASFETGHATLVNGIWVVDADCREARILGPTVLTHPAVRPNEIWAFAEPLFAGEARTLGPTKGSFLLNNEKFWLDKKGNQIEMVAYMEIGPAYVNRAVFDPNYKPPPPPPKKDPEDAWDEECTSPEVLNTINKERYR